MIDSMLERIREIWAKLRPDPAKTSLGWWMVAIHVAIVLLVGGGISYSAIRMLHDLADEQGKSRVQLAGALAAPLQKMAGLLQALPRNFAYGLSALIDQKKEGNE